MIDLESLSVTFGEGKHAVRAVDRVSFHVAQGSAFGLVGESGSGKSTVLRAVAGLIDGWTGRILVHGRPIGRNRSRAERGRLQMVFQDPYGSLHPRQTIDRILSEPCRIHRMDRIGQRVEDALREVGLGPAFRYRYPHQLSGGQRQRVVIARAIVLPPSVLVCDEPTSALDVSLTATVVNLLHQLRDDLGLAVLFVTHDLGVARSVADEIAVLQDGRVVERGAAPQVLDAPAHTATRELLDAMPEELR